MIYVDINNNTRSIEVDEIIQQLTDLAINTPIVLKHRFRDKAIRYWNIPAAFDIETTSSYKDKNKIAWMYEWTFGIGDHIYIGRTWEEYELLISLINKLLSKAVLFVGVHNLAFEFQFIRTHFTWDEVFSNDKRKPIKALSDNIEYRCTATISALPLAKLAENLVEHKIEKLKGDLDYKQIRTKVTPLSKEELQYCINDVRIILYYLEEQIKICGNIAKIPLTNTGRVRNYCKEHCLTVTKKNGKKGRNLRYIAQIANETLDPELYEECKLAFRGGFTHANPIHNGETLHNVSSYDLTSAYPSVMIYERYPAGEPERIDLKDFDEGAFDWYINNRACLFRATFVNLRMKEGIADNYISWIPHKMEVDDLDQLNNGRITNAGICSLYITDVDYNIIKQAYDWDELYVTDMVLWFKNYLRPEFIKCILKFYKDKTTLKGVKDKIIEYQAGKGMLNSCYGMMVQDICKDQNVYNGKWGVEQVNIEDKIGKYNTAAMRFTYYPVGLWVTAYCRRLIWEAIFDLGNDYVYSDTDSIKCLGDHSQWFKDKNEEIRNKVYAAMDYHKMEKSEVEPETIDGVKKLIGVWDYEGTYTTFKTLGAKRYMTCIEDEYVTPIRTKYKPVRLSLKHYELTVSGVTKSAMDYIKTFKDPFEEFNYKLNIPSKYTGKLTHTYLDDPITLEVEDYLGNICVVNELSSVHLEPVEYSMDPDLQFIEWIKKLRGERLNDIQ